jgi:hypothetical protein
VALGEVADSPVLPLFDVQRALRERSRRTQELAQEITFRRLRGLTPAEIRKSLEIDDDWYAAAEALCFDAMQAVVEELEAAVGRGLERRRPQDGLPTLLDWPVGRMLVLAREIMSLRVRHAEMILSARAIDHRLTLAEVRQATGIDEESFRVARKWLEDAGLALRDD